jgi:hypothetical protein
MFYPYPEEKCYFKRILKDDVMNERKNNPGSMEPEVIIGRLNYQRPWKCYMFLSNLKGQLDDYMFQLLAHSK